jgi:hypothetical protein
MPEITHYLDHTMLHSQGSTPEVLTPSLHRAQHRFETVLTAFGDDQLHHIPALERWSAAQICEHVLMVNIFIPRAILKALHHHTDPSIALIEMDKGQLSDTGTALDPSGRVMGNDRPRDELLHHLNKGIEVAIELTKRVAREDAGTWVCMKQPFFGWVSCWESLQLIAWHTNHHAKQLEALKIELMSQ